MQHRLYDCERETDLARTWQLLRAGRLFLSDSHCDNGRCFALLETWPRELRVPTAHLSLLERTFQGESQKALALELGVSVATLAGYCKVALGAVTRPSWVSRAPILLVMAALASCSGTVVHARLDDERSDGRYLLSVEVPGETFGDRLTASECHVARLSIQGETHAGVARLRGTSERTVANQLASIFGKLRISGRSELRAKAVHEYTMRAPSAAPRSVFPVEASSLSLLRAAAC